MSELDEFRKEVLAFYKTRYGLPMTGDQPKGSVRRALEDLYLDPISLFVVHPRFRNQAINVYRERFRAIQEHLDPNVRREGSSIGPLRKIMERHDDVGCLKRVTLECGHEEVFNICEDDRWMDRKQRRCRACGDEQIKKE